jgi:hypothetical protein
VVDEVRHWTGGRVMARGRDIARGCVMARGCGASSMIPS